MSKPVTLYINKNYSISLAILLVYFLFYKLELRVLYWGIFLWNYLSNNFFCTWESIWLMKLKTILLYDYLNNAYCFDIIWTEMTPWRFICSPLVKSFVAWTLRIFFDIFVTFCSLRNVDYVTFSQSFINYFSRVLL